MTPEALLLALRVLGGLALAGVAVTIYALARVAARADATDGRCEE